MKPKEFIERFNIQKGWNPRKQEEFLNDMTSEFLASLEVNHSENNIKGFDNAVRVIRMKWDSISNKIPYGLPDKLWNYYFATVIAKIREQMCPEQMARRREEAAKRKAEWERRQQIRAEEQAYWDDIYKSWYDNLFGRMAAMFLRTEQKPIESFSILGLNENATEDEVKTAYRKLSLETHPDRGGDKEIFITVTEAKNKCLAWFNNKK